MKSDNSSRRNFIRKIMLGSAGMSVLGAGQLGLIRSAFADSTVNKVPTDYKALVCIYLYGGNDSANMIVPINGQARTDYEALRDGLSVNNPLEINHGISGLEGGLGFMPTMTKLKSLYDKGKLAIQANVGTHYGDHFAHNSQQEAWMRGAELKYSKGNGWAANMLELLSENAEPHYLQNVSLFGNNTWSSGANSRPLSIGASSIPNMALYHHHSDALERKSNIETHFKNMANDDHILLKEYARTFLRTEDQSEELTKSLAELAPVEGFGESSLSQQLKRVLELIQLQSKHNISRQIFFVGLPGFDTHKGQETLNKESVGYHSSLLADLSESMGDFYAATEKLGLQDQVTSFTMSEFGRTMTYNSGGGTDHGWGGHQFIMGGAVNGGFYGEMPRLAMNAEHVLDKGILEPTTHAEQMTSALAKWYGLSDSQCKDIFPKLTEVAPMNYFS